jgi:AraC family transcriptional regulator of adaptative response/methylated-DNA-[protein]-cysteine methyltransferase
MRATFEAGYGSSSRVYERAHSALGMTPGVMKRAGAGERIQFAIVASPLGRLIGAYTEKGVCWVAIGIDDAKLERDFRSAFAKADVRPAGAAIHEWITAIVKSLEGEGSASLVPLDTQGTVFQWRVWQALQRIPRGTTLTYSEVAKRIGQPSAVRAVARACATNPVALVVPCHRVIRNDGDMGGYRWGVERKEEILRRERA